MKTNIVLKINGPYGGWLREQTESYKEGTLGFRIAEGVHLDWKAAQLERKSLARQPC